MGFWPGGPVRACFLQAPAWVISGEAKPLCSTALDFSRQLGLPQRLWISGELPNTIFQRTAGSTSTVELFALHVVQGLLDHCLWSKTLTFLCHLSDHPPFLGYGWQGTLLLTIRLTSLPSNMLPRVGPSSSHLFTLPRFPIPVDQGPWPWHLPRVAAPQISRAGPPCWQASLLSLS